MCLDIDELISFFSNREWALIFWGIIVLIGILLSSKLRDDLQRCIKLFFAPKLCCIFAIGCIWAFVGIYLLYCMGLWEITILKDTIVYIVFSLTSLLGVGIKLNSKKELIPIGLQNAKINSIIAFYINLFSFNFIIEFIGLPIIVLLALVQSYAEYSKEAEHKKVASCLTITINTISTVCVIIALCWLIKNWQIIVQEETILSLLLPIFLTMWVIPYVYGLAIYCRYEEWFVTLYFRSNKDDSIYKYRKKLILETCGIDLDKIVYISKHLHTYTSQTKKEFSDRLNEINSNYKLNDINSHK